MNKIYAEVVEIKMSTDQIKKRKMSITLETKKGSDFIVPRTMEKFVMVPEKEFKDLEEKASMYDGLCK